MNGFLNITANVSGLAEVAGLEALNFKIRTNDYRKHKN